MSSLVCDCLIALHPALVMNVKEQALLNEDVYQICRQLLAVRNQPVVERVLWSATFIET
jgi:hypothetical protein